MVKNFMKVNFNNILVKVKKNKILLITLSCIILTVVLSMVFLNSKSGYYGKNPIKEVNENRSQILVTGSKYAMDYKQEEEYIEQEQQRAEIRKENQEKIGEQTGVASAENSKTENGKPGEGSDDPGGGSEGPGGNVGGDEDESKKPKIECTLTNGQNVSGNYLSFDARATSYKQQIISSFDMYVAINGTRVTSSGTDARGWVTYKDDGTLVDGSNVIVIKATDAEGYTSSVKYVVNVNLSGERPKEGFAYITVDAPSIGIGTIFSRKIEVYEGENVSSVLLRAFDGTPITASFTGSINHGFYLSRIRSANILAGWSVDMIEPRVKKRLDDMNASFMGLPNDVNSLGEKDLYQWSGWVVAYNGIYGDGMSTQSVLNGDEIRLSFTLHMGDEYNGTWPECCL